MQTESPEEQLTDLPKPSLQSFSPPVGKQCQQFKDVAETKASMNTMPVI